MYVIAVKLGFALKLNKRLIKAEQLELQKELELAYEDFSKKINDYCPQQKY